LSNRRILLVEDNPDDEALTLRGLRDGGWNADTTVARDGVTALEKLDSMVTLPSLMLLDLKLPKLDGSEVLQKIRLNERTRPLCVVIFTSSNEPGDISRCYKLGCNGYVIKPVAYENYIEAVQQIGRYWLALNSTPPRD
jgi:two-component system, response regulator